MLFLTFHFDVFIRFEVALASVSGRPDAARVKLLTNNVTLYRGSAYILLGRWIDANDLMYIESLAVDEKQCPPFCHRFGGGYPILSSAH